MSLAPLEHDAVGAVVICIPGTRPHVERSAVHISRIVEPVVTTAAVICIETRRLVFPGHAVADGVAHPRLAAPRLETVAVAILRLAGAVVAVAVAHRPAVLNNHREFLANKIPAVIAVPPGTATDELCRIATLLVVHAKAVGILTISLAPVRVVVVVTVAVQEQMSAAASRALLVHEESRTAVVVAIDQFQEDMLTAGHVHAHI